MSISAVVLTKNEEKNIAGCLESLQWCDEIIVIDDNSLDKTVELAKKQKAIVFTHDLENDFAAQRNFGLEKAKGDWVLFVDADERVSHQLRNEIQQITADKDSDIHGYYLKRQDYMWGKQLKHGEQGQMQLLRLAKKALPAGRQGSGKWYRKVHETWNIEGSTQVLQNPLLHYPHATVADYLKEINFYSTVRAQELKDQGKSANWLSIIVYAKGKFIQDYFLTLGFLDGIEGFLVAIIMSFYSFLVRGKLWQLTKKN